MLLKTNLYKCIFKLQHLFKNFPQFKQRKRQTNAFLGGIVNHSVSHAIKAKNRERARRQRENIINQMLTGWATCCHGLSVRSSPSHVVVFSD